MTTPLIPRIYMDSDILIIDIIGRTVDFIVWGWEVKLRATAVM